MISPPTHRPRRLRAHAWLRDLVQEHRLHPSDLIWPVFIQEGEQQDTPVASLPGVSRLSIDLAIAQAKALHAKGLQAIALFPVTPPALKHEMGDEALNSENLICRAIRAFKREIPTLGLITDIALDPYTSHGHDGVLDAGGDVANDATVAILCKQAVLQAQAGADIIAPSDMMDGRVAAIRHALDEAGHANTPILAYTAKYASAFYGPFRDAVGSSKTNQKSGGSYTNKATYQMHPANAVEAIKEAELDIAEGADMLMVKPGLPYLDIIHTLSSHSTLPIFAYHVSGEYAGVMFAAEAGAIDAQAALSEHMLCFKRAGATAILTYAAPMLLEWMAAS